MVLLWSLNVIDSDMVFVCCVCCYSCVCCLFCCVFLICCLCVVCEGVFVLLNALRCVCC